MKKCALLFLLVCICLSVIGCGHTHEWQPATCTSAKICTGCGETDGEALGHNWTDATCTESKFCAVCGLTSGDALGHTWVDADCVTAKTCEICGKEDGTALGHTLLPATCTDPEICSVCGASNGESLGHTVETWEAVITATCTEAGAEEGICAVCGETCTQEIPLAEHTPGDWEILVQPTSDKKGTRAKYCVDCEAELEKEDFTLSEEELEQLYKNNCKSISYDSLSRTPGEYEDAYVKFSGYVVQICSEAKSALYYSTYRVATSGRYDNVVYVKIDNYGSGSRILEDDYITFYGQFDGLYTYETVRGDSITIPSVIAEYVD